MKNLKIFGKKISVTLIALLAMAGLASAGLLSFYGRVVGTAEVSQSVKVDGRAWNVPIEEPIEDAIAGNTYTTLHTITNDAEVDADIEIVLLSKEGPKDLDDKAEGLEVSYSSPGEDQECGTNDDEAAPTKVPKKGSVDFCIIYEFDIAAYPGDYSATTQVNVK